MPTLLAKADSVAMTIVLSSTQRIMMTSRPIHSSRCVITLRRQKLVGSMSGRCRRGSLKTSHKSSNISLEEALVPQTIVRVLEYNCPFVIYGLVSCCLLSRDQCLLSCVKLPIVWAGDLLSYGCSVCLHHMCRSCPLL